jgi:hypothetical protein
MLRRGCILFVVGSLAVGGAESQLVMLAERLKMRGWSIIVFPLVRSGPLLRQLEQAGIDVTDGGYNPGSATRIGTFINLCVCQARLIWCLLRARPDVVHGFLPLSNCLCATDHNLETGAWQTSGPRANNEVAGLDCQRIIP